MILGVYRTTKPWVVHAFAWTLLVVSAPVFAADPVLVSIAFVSRGDIMRVVERGQERVVMLYGVTCPEIDTPWGAQAQRFTQQFLTKRVTFMQVRYQQPGVDYVEIRRGDGQVLNHALLSAGLGKLDTVTAAADSAYAAFEERAKEEQAGMWRPGATAEPTAPLPEDMAPDPQENYRRIQRFADEVTYAAEFEHWQALTEAERAEVRRELTDRAAVESSEAAARLESASDSLSDVESEIAEVEEDVATARQSIADGETELAEAVEALYRDDPDLKRLEGRLVDATAAAEIALRDYGGGSDVYFRQLEEAQISEQMLAQRSEFLAGEEVRIQEEAAVKRIGLEEELAALEESLDDLNRERGRHETQLGRAEAAADTRAASAENSLGTVDELDAALQAEYQPGLAKTPVGVWRGRGETVTPAFDVKQDVWVLDYDAGVDAGSRELKITVRRESNDEVAYQAIDNTPLHQSFAVIKPAGSYYLEVRSPGSLEWSITVTGYSKP